MVREQACLQLEALFAEHPNLVFDCYRFAEAKSDSQRHCQPPKREKADLLLNEIGDCQGDQ